MTRDLLLILAGTLWGFVHGWYAHEARVRGRIADYIEKLEREGEPDSLRGPIGGVVSVSGESGSPSASHSLPERDAKAKTKLGTEPEWRSLLRRS